MYKNQTFLREALRNSGLTQQEFADKIGKTRGTLNNWLKKGVSKENWLLIESAIFGQTVSNYKEPPPYVEIVAEGKPIVVANTEVYATISPDMSDVVTMKPEAFINIPMFNQGEYAVKVSGNSMHPFIRHGDYIIVKEVVNKDFIIYGECYLVVTKSDNFKTVAFLNEIQEDQDVLYLSKYNTEQFTGQRIPKSEILKLFKVIGRFGDINL